MKTIFDLYESLLDNIDVTIEKGTIAIEEQSIKDFIFNNYNIKTNMSTPIKDSCDISGLIKIMKADSIYEVEINGDVELTNKSLKKLTDGSFEFKNINGNFTVLNANIETLQYGPKYVSSFYIGSCDNLKSLQYCPKYAFDFSIIDCHGIKDLKYVPEAVDSTINLSGSSIMSLKGLSKIDIKNPEGLMLVCKNCNNLKDLSGCHKKTIALICSDCENLETFKGCPSITKAYGRYSVDCSNCPKLRAENLPKKLLNGINIKGCPLIKKNDIRRAGCMTTNIACDRSQE